MSVSTESADGALPTDVRAFLNARPEPEFIEAFIVDINGVLRGKRLPLATVPKLYEKGLCLPASTALLDITSEDVAETGIVLETGDEDHLCHPVVGSLRPLPWSRRPAGQLFLHLHGPDGEMFPGDPRTILTRARERLSALGLTPVVATEFEFRLFAPDLDAGGYPRIPERCSAAGRRSQLYGLDELDQLDALFTDIEAACKAQDLPMDTLIAEQGEGHYEINLGHVDDILLAADQAMLLKRTIKSCARQHGLAASFMAKPFGDGPGSGLHVHISLLDEQGDNIFTESGEPSASLLYAVAGLLETMADATAVFAPHGNSYRRFQKASHAPMAPTWGFDNRTTALRLPLAEPKATRIEHRVAGADANPYLVLAAIASGIAYGLTHELTPPPETRGNGYDSDAQPLPDSWGDALARFESSSFIGRCFGTEYQAWFVACKRQEREKLRRIVPPAEYDLYWQTV